MTLAAGKHRSLLQVQNGRPSQTGSSWYEHDVCRVGKSRILLANEAAKSQSGFSSEQLNESSLNSHWGRIMLLVERSANTTWLFVCYQQTTVRAATILVNIYSISGFHVSLFRESFPVAVTALIKTNTTDPQLDFCGLFVDAKRNLIKQCPVIESHAVLKQIISYIMFTRSWPEKNILRRILEPQAGTTFWIKNQDFTPVVFISNANNCHDFSF